VVDCWTRNYASEGYIGVRAYYLSHTFALKTALLCIEAFRPRHTAERISAKLLSVLGRFDLTRERADTLVTDDASNNRGLVDLGWRVSPCMQHAVNNGVWGAIKEDHVVQEVLDRTSDVMWTIKNAHVLSDLLKRVQFDLTGSRLFLRPRGYIQHRWFSLAPMITQLERLLPAIRQMIKVVRDETTTQGRIAVDSTLLEQVDTVDELAPKTWEEPLFFQVRDILSLVDAIMLPLCMGTSPTLCNVLEGLHKLRRDLSDYARRSGVLTETRRFSETLHTRILGYFQWVMPECYLAAACSPRNKDGWFTAEATYIGAEPAKPNIPWDRDPIRLTPNAANISRFKAEATEAFETVCTAMGDRLGEAANCLSNAYGETVRLYGLTAAADMPTSSQQSTAMSSQYSGGDDMELLQGSTTAPSSIPRTDSEWVAAAMAEWASYVDVPRPVPMQSIGEWWTSNWRRWPLIACVAQKVLAAPATSMSIEKSFRHGAHLAKLKPTKNPESFNYTLVYKDVLLQEALAMDAKQAKVSYAPSPVSWSAYDETVAELARKAVTNPASPGTSRPSREAVLQAEESLTNAVIAASEHSGTDSDGQDYVVDTEDRSETLFQPLSTLLTAKTVLRSKPALHSQAGKSYLSTHPPSSPAPSTPSSASPTSDAGQRTPPPSSLSSSRRSPQGAGINLLLSLAEQSVDTESGLPTDSPGAAARSSTPRLPSEEGALAPLPSSPSSPPVVPSIARSRPRRETAIPTRYGRTIVIGSALNEGGLLTAMDRTLNAWPHDNAYRLGLELEHVPDPSVLDGEGRPVMGLRLRAGYSIPPNTPFT